MMSKSLYRIAITAELTVNTNMALPSNPCEGVTMWRRQCVTCACVCGGVMRVGEGVMSGGGEVMREGARGRG